MYNINERYIIDLWMILSSCQAIRRPVPVVKKKKAAKFLGDGSIREITARPLAFSISSRSSLYAWFHWTGQPDSNYDSLLLRDRRKKRRTKKKKKRQMRTFLKFRENSVRNLCPSWNSNRSETPFIYERNFNIWFIWTLSFISRNFKLQNEQ